ncbi:Eukaryotic aspartyl protease family protein [Raphanus sativus]|nr:Eukaryotic aspartyl protease family protein [Raphanus sativus]
MSAFVFKSTLFLIPLLTLLNIPSCSKARIFHLRDAPPFLRRSQALVRFNRSIGSFPPKGSFDYLQRPRHPRSPHPRTPTPPESESESESSASHFLRWQLHFSHQLPRIFALHDGEIGNSGMSLHGGARHRKRPLLGPLLIAANAHPTQGPAYSFCNLFFFNTSTISSSKVTCNNSLCAQRNQCLGTFSTCPYMVSYVSAQTSTSGVLMEDVMHLTTGDKNPERVEAYVTFGCGQVQSGSFLDIAAPNGLFGLGMEKISVPSVWRGRSGC